MPKQGQVIDLDKFKADPKLWMRLATPYDKGDVLRNVFKEKDDPFAKDGIAAMAIIQQLAAEGKLYLREKGRSRHFQQVKLEGKDLKLGDQHEMKITNRNSGFVLAGLMWLSRGYFKWIGLERISKWFDKRLERRQELKALSVRYKQEYKEMSKEEKKALKALRKHEKVLKKLEKIQKEVEKSQQDLDHIRGEDSTNTKGEMQAPLNQPPEVKPKENTMQPTLTGDVPVQQQQPTVQQQQPTVQQQQPTVQQQQPKTDFVSVQTGQQEFIGKKKETPQKMQIFIEGVELTEETAKQFPPHVVEAFKLIQQLIIEKENNQKEKQQEQAPAQPEANREEQVLTDVEQQVPVQPEANQEEQVPVQPEANREEQVLTDVEQQANLQAVDDLEMNQNEPVLNTNQVEEVFQPVNIPNVTEREMTQEELEEMFSHIEEPEMTQEELERMFEGTDAPVQTNDLTHLEQLFQNNAEQVQKEMPAPLNDPPKVEEDKVSIQGRHKDQAELPLQERLVAEKEAMNSVQNWEGHVAKSLFAHEENSTAKDYYDMIKDEKDGPEFLMGTVCGILSNDKASPEQKQQAMDALLDGKPLGGQNAELINNGVMAFNEAKQRQTEGNGKVLAEMVASTMQILSRQTSQETTLSPRVVMLGKLIGNAAQLATEKQLELPLTEDDMELAQGAVTMAEVAQSYHDARQRLGSNLDMGSSKGRNAVRDLLMGNAVERMIQQDKKQGQEITFTQQLMGRGIWTQESLKVYTSEAFVKRQIQKEDIQTILEKPNSSKACGIGTKMATDIARTSMEDLDVAEKAFQAERDLEKQEQQTQLDPVNMPR